MLKEKLFKKDTKYERRDLIFEIYKVLKSINL